MRRFLRQLFCRHVWLYETLPGEIMGHGRLVRSCLFCERFERREIYDSGGALFFRRVDEASERRSRP